HHGATRAGAPSRSYTGRCSITELHGQVFHHGATRAGVPSRSYSPSISSVLHFETVSLSCPC
ncbi:hypothetical protein LEMLEM_LOCUS10431, partial [Lemmus lemmus]